MTQTNLSALKTDITCDDSRSCAEKLVQARRCACLRCVGSVNAGLVLTDPGHGSAGDFYRGIEEAA